MPSPDLPARSVVAGATAARRSSIYIYSYDLVTNRTQIIVNGGIADQRSYDGADQVIRWSYDAAGNPVSDGAQTTLDLIRAALTVRWWLGARHQAAAPARRIPDASM